MARVLLNDIAYARSGDKGGNANVGVWGRSPAAYAWLREHLTVEQFVADLDNLLTVLAARGIAVNTAGPGQEEFPVFREFWVETPGSEAQSSQIYALLDGESLTGACHEDDASGGLRLGRVRGRRRGRREPGRQRGSAVAGQR